MVIIEDISESEEYIAKNKLLRDGIRVVDTALKSGADEAEAFLVKGKDIYFDIEKDRISHVSSGNYYGIGIRVLKNGKIGFGYTTKPERCQDVIDRAISISRISKRTHIDLPEGKGFKGPVPEVFDTSFLELEFQDMKEMAQSIISGAKEYREDITVSNGGFGVGIEYVALVNSNALEVADARTTGSTSAYCVSKNSGISTGFDFMISTCIADIRPSLVGESAARLCASGEGAKRLMKRVTDVLFMPYAFSAIMEATLGRAIIGENATRPGGYYYNKCGEKLYSDAVTLRDNGRMPRGVNSLMMDDEGTPSKDNILVEEGVLKQFIFDLVSGADAGEGTTGNAVRAGKLSSSHSYKHPPTTHLRNLVLEGGRPRYIRRDMEDIVSEMDRGIVVYDVMGAHTANPISGDFSVNAPIVFQVDKGEIVRPLKSLMVSGNIHDALRHVVFMSKEQTQVTSGLSPASVFSPGVWVGDVNVTP